MKLTIIATAFHRNGICGSPFDVVLFEDDGPEGSRKLAILFDEPGHCAVLDVAKLAAGDIKFGSNSWRGDRFEQSLRKAISISSTPTERNTSMKVYDNYEISPCRRYEEPDSPGRFYFEVCEPHEANVWTLYGHIDGEGVEAIGDFATREHAEEVFRRITGIPFIGSREVMARLRVMHAGPALLAKLKAMLSQIDEDVPTDRTTRHFAEAYDEACAAVAEAEGKAV